MIKENQRLFNQINVLTDAIIIYVSLPIAFLIRFYLIPLGVISEPLHSYSTIGLFLTFVQVLIYGTMGLYNISRSSKKGYEIKLILLGSVFVIVLLMSLLFIGKEHHYSRLTLAIFFVLSTGLLVLKRIFVRRSLRYIRQKGYNAKTVLVIGSGNTAFSYIQTIRNEKELGYNAIGYVATEPSSSELYPTYLGNIDELYSILEEYRPDEVVSAVDIDDNKYTSNIIEACEKSGIKLSIIPFFLDYLSSNPQFDAVGDIPLLNIRRVPLENQSKAFIKRTLDIVGSLIIILLTSPIMLFCAVGVKLSSPGPVIFKQERVGLNNMHFFMWKFRSMQINDQEDTAWSTNNDSRKTSFGAFIRKFSLDEFPQFFNVLKGDMSLVGPRPEIPYFVEQFKDTIPRYKVKHQVRPGITGWAQINGFRGDTSIKERISYDLYYIENWSLWFDIKILFTTVFKRKFINKESWR